MYQDVSGQSLDHEMWYHGVLPRDEVQRLLLNDGDFLVRLSSNKRTGQDQYVMSVRCLAALKHFIIQQTPEVCIREVFKVTKAKATESKVKATESKVKAVTFIILSTFI